MFSEHSLLPSACIVGGALKGNWHNQENHEVQLQAIPEGMPRDPTTLKADTCQQVQQEDEHQ